MNPDVQAAMPELEKWIGRKRVVEDEIGLTSVQRVAATMDVDPASFKNGDPIPRQWFNMFFPDICAQSDLGPDGHPNKGVFLPPIPLPRRMGAGRRVQIMGNLVVGQPATKTAEVAAILPKSGRSGNICVLTMRLTFETGGKVIAVDEFDAIYREAVPPGTKTSATKTNEASTDSEWQETIHFTETMNFRYGAVSWNAHRIHYDADYTRTEEGYDHTVQNGGLTMQTVTDAACRHTDKTITGLTARLTKPIWVGDTVTIHGKDSDGGMLCWIADKHGHLCAEMTFDFA
jgi:3-methylfumaryl-CoA hydratase